MAAGISMTDHPDEPGVGATLRHARESQGRTLEDAAQVLRARVSQVRALEEERFDEFGGEVYARWFLKNYAQLLGLDPAAVLESYRRQTGAEDPTVATGSLLTVGSPPRERSLPPGWVAWVLVGVVVLAGVALLTNLGDGRAPDQAAAEDPAGPPPASSSEDEAPDGDADAEEDTSREEPAGEEEDVDPEPEPIEGVELLIALEDASWLRVVVDGAVALERLAETGETLRFEADQEIQVRYGSAGGARVELNGEDLGLPGSRGEVVDVRYTPDGVDVL